MHSVGQDSKKFVELITKINLLLSRKQDRLDSGHSNWKIAFDTAFRETDLEQLRKHIMRAEEAIYLNTQEQVNSSNDAESEAMKEAILVLGDSGN